MIKLSTIFKTIYYSFILLILCSELFDFNNIFNTESLFNIVLLLFLLIFSQNFQKLNENPLYVYFQIHIIIFFLFRMIVLCFFPSSFTYEHFVITENDIIISSRYLFIGTLFMVLAFILSPSVKLISNLDFAYFFKFYNEKYLLIISLLIVMLKFYLSLTVGYYTTEEVSTPPWIFRFIGDDFIPFGLVVTYFFASNKNISRISLFLSIIFIFTMAFLGSRASIYNIILTAVIIRCMKDGDFLISKKTIYSFIFITPISIIMYFFSTALRMMRGYGEDLNILSHIGKSDSISFNIINTLSSRFQDFEALTVIVNNKGRNTELLYNFVDAIKSSVNVMIPGGDVFQGVYKFHNYYRYSFLNQPFDYSVDIRSYLTMPLTIWGEFYLYFGFAGGYLALFISILILNGLYVKCSRFFKVHKILILYLFVYCFQFFLVAFGLDFTVSKIIGCITMFISYFLLINCLNLFIKNSNKSISI